MRALVAIAHDSFREAAETKLSTFMFGVSAIVGLVCLIVGGLDEVPVEKLVESALRESGAFAGFVAAPVGPRKVELRVGEDVEPRRRSARHEAELTPVERLERCVERLRRTLERRGVRSVRTLEPPADGPAGSPRALLELDYDAYDVRGASRLSLAFGAKVVDLDFNLAEGTDVYAGFSGREYLLFVESFIAQLLAGWAGLVIAVIATAGFMPSMLSGGTAHLFLSKPVRRSTILLGKYAGGVAFVAFHATVIAALCALAIFARTGWFDARFLMTPVAVAAIFSVLYSVSVLAAVVFETPVVSVLATLAFWMCCWGAAAAKNGVKNFERATGKKLELPGALERAIDAVYYALPKTNDMGRLLDGYLSQGRLTADAARTAAEMQANLDPLMVAWTSALFTALVLALGCFVFRRRDY